MKKFIRNNEIKFIYLAYIVFYGVIILGVSKCSSDLGKKDHQPSWLGTGGNYAE